MSASYLAWHAQRCFRVPSVLHEALRDLFSERPELLAPLLRSMLELPEGDLVATGSELTDPRMKQLLPDAVLACPNQRAPQAILIVEVQLSIDERKRRAWPHYIAAVHARHRCRIEVVVVTPDVVVERWARQPIVLGRRSSICPEVLGPQSIPMLEASQLEQAPALGVLSTLAHMDDDRAPQQALWTLEALRTLPDDLGPRLGDILEAALTDAVRREMEELMRTGNYEYKSDFAKKYFAEGRAEGQARALLLILQARGITVDARCEHRIKSERDEERLDDWARRAATANRLEDIFDDA